MKRWYVLLVLIKESAKAYSNTGSIAIHAIRTFSSKIQS